MDELPLEQRLAKEFHVPAKLTIREEEGTFIGGYNLRGKDYFVYMFDRGAPVYATLERKEINERWLHANDEK
jgi:hypothetical protein